MEASSLSLRLADHLRDLLHPVQATGATAPSRRIPNDRGRRTPDMHPRADGGEASALAHDVAKPRHAFGLHDLDQLRFDAADQLGTLIGERRIKLHG